MSQQTASGSDPSEKPENAPVSRRTIDPERMDSLSFSFNHDQLRIDNTRKEIATVVTVLSRLESERENMDSSVHDADLITNLEKDATLRGHLRKLRNKLNLLEWRAFASSKSLVALDPMVVDRLLDIQKETASSVGALAALGASLSLSILYSGTRGDMWAFFVAWWFFIIALAIVTSLALSSVASGLLSGSDLLETQASDASLGLSAATSKNWRIQRLAIVLNFICLFSITMGFASFCGAVAGFSLTDELHGSGPRVTAGPDLGPRGIRLWARIVTYIIIGVLGLTLSGSYLYRMKVRPHGRSHSI